MMTDADEYRRKGDEATLAEMDSEIPFVRQMYAKVANHWYELANQVERQQAAAADDLEPQLAEADEPEQPPQPTLAEVSAAFDFFLANRTAAASCIAAEIELAL